MSRILSRAAVSVCALLVACSGALPAERVVLSRLGDAAQSGTPPQRVKRVVLGHAARPGVCGVSGFALRVPQGARALRLALGHHAGAAAELVVSAGDERLQVFRLDPGAVGWVERTLELPVVALQTGSVSLQGLERGVCVGSVLFEGRADADPPPSFVVVILDTLAAHALGSFQGLPGVSPGLDSFLEGSLDFRRAYAQFGSTFVSHSSLFSALYPVRHGRYNRPDPRYGRGRPPLLSLVGELAANGYSTVAFTENAYVGSSFGFDAGFDVYDDGDAPPFESSSGDSARTFDRAARWLEEIGRERRFLLLVHTYEVHSPYVPRDAAAQTFADAASPGDRRLFESRSFHANVARQNAGERVFAPEDFRRLRALYSGEVHYLDRVVDDFLSRVRELTRDRRVVVVLTSDHGEQFGAGGRLLHGVGLHNRVLHVPLAFAGPGIVSGASEAPVQLVDVFPTLLDLAGLPVPEGRDGRSLAPLLRGEVSALPQRAAYSEERRRRRGCDFQKHGDACLVLRDAVQSGRFKLVQARGKGAERLFDLVRDPGETLDVSVSHPSVLAKHRALLDAYRRLPPTLEAPPAAPAPIDAETRRRLEALGYTP